MGFVDIIRRWWVTLCVAALVGGVSGYFIADNIKPSYEASAEVLVGAGGTSEVLKSSGQLAQTYAFQVRTDPVVDDAARAAKLAGGRFRGEIRAVANSVTRILTIRVRSGNRTETAAMANALAEQVEVFAEAGGTTPEGTVAIIEPAKVPGKPVAPNVSLIVALSTLAGLVAAAGLIFLVEYVSDTVKVPDDLGELTGAAFVTPVGRFRRRQHPLLEVEARPQSAVSESLRLAATSADLLFVDRASSLLIIGVDEGAGSAEITANLAASLATQGRRVALIDATHDSAVTKLLDLDERSDSTDTKVGDLTLQRVALAGGASLLLMKSVEVGALSQLGAEDAQELIDELRETCDRIVIHADPPTHYASTLVFARTADATVLVARRHQTRRGALAETADGLRRIGARVMGVVLNERRAYEGLTLRKPSPKPATVGADSALARAVAAAASLATQPPPRPRDEVREPPAPVVPAVRPATQLGNSWTCRCGRENPGAFPHCPRCGRSQPDEVPRTG
jgi:Mrp family chromosome partitioning ATPase/capsular polysaccharide biosynthesis protein